MLTPLQAATESAGEAISDKFRDLTGQKSAQVKVELHGDLLTIRGEKREDNRAEEKDEGGRVVYLRTERIFFRQPHYATPSCFL